MPRAREWVGDLLLRTPESLRSLRNVPFVGNLIHRVSHSILPMDQKVWARVEKGPAAGLWLELNSRTAQSYLRGAAKLLQSPGRPWIVMEMHLPALDQAARATLGSCGYQLTEADELHVLAVPVKQ